MAKADGKKAAGQTKEKSVVAEGAKRSGKGSRSTVEKDARGRPESRLVLFINESLNHQFVIETSMPLSRTSHPQTKQVKVGANSVALPFYNIEISSANHPAYNLGMGNKLLDTAGRIEKFGSRYQKLGAAKEAAAEAAKAKPVKTAKKKI